MNKVKGYRKRDGTYVHPHFRRDRMQSETKETTDPSIENAKDIEDARRHREG